MTERSIFDDINKTISNLLQQEQRTVPNRENTNQDLEESKDQVVFEEYNPLACPPDLAKAKKHGKARRVAQFLNNQEAQEDYCEDCGLPIKNKLFPLCTSRLDLAELGAGFPLFYEYIFFCGVLLTLLFLIVGIYGLVVNKQGFLCDALKDQPEDPCNGGLFIEFSLGNRDSRDSLKVTSLLNLAFVGLGAILSFYYRRMQSQTAHKANLGTITPSDYAILVKKLPITETVQSIKAFFEQKASVRKVIMSYNIHAYLDLTRKRQKLLTKKARGNTSTEEEIEIREIEEKINLFEEEVTSNEASQKFNGIAFVIFETEEETNEVITNFQMKFYHKVAKFLGWTSFLADKGYSNGVLIEVTRAPEPFDILWENLGYEWWEVIKKRLATNTSSLLIIVCSFGAILGINYVQTHFKESLTSNQYIITLLSMAVSLVVNVINGILGIFVRMLSGFEKHQTFTSYFISVAKKLSYAQFTNTAIITLLVQIIVSNDNEIKLWTADGMVPKVYYLYIFNAILPSISYLIDPLYFIQLWKRWRVSSNPSKSKLTQHEANLLFEGPEVDMPELYANIQKTMLFTGFYANLVPAGILISLIGLIITYWINKYMLLRRHSRPKALGKESTEEMSNFLGLFFMSFTAGNLIFDRVILDDIFNYNWIAFIIAGVCYFSPQRWIVSCFHKTSGDVVNLQKYDDIKYTFISDYDRANPITKKEAMKEWFDQLMSITRLQEENKNGSTGQNKVMIPFFQNLPPANALKVLLKSSSSDSFSRMNSGHFNILNNIPMAQTKLFQMQFIKMLNLNHSVDLNNSGKSSKSSSPVQKPAAPDFHFDLFAIIEEAKASQKNPPPPMNQVKPINPVKPVIEITPTKPAPNTLLSNLTSSTMRDTSQQPQGQLLQTNQIRINNNKSNLPTKSYQSLWSQMYEDQDQINLS